MNLPTVQNKVPILYYVLSYVLLTCFNFLGTIIWKISNLFYFSLNWQKLEKICQNDDRQKECPELCLWLHTTCPCSHKHQLTIHLVTKKLTSSGGNDRLQSCWVVSSMLATSWDMPTRTPTPPPSIRSTVSEWLDTSSTSLEQNNSVPFYSITPTYQIKKCIMYSKDLHEIV